MFLMLCHGYVYNSYISSEYRRVGMMFLFKSKCDCCVMLCESVEKPSQFYLQVLSHHGMSLCFNLLDLEFHSEQISEEMNWIEYQLCTAYMYMHSIHSFSIT
jgi:hypothetical protein